MNEITTLFTAIGEFFTKSAWYSMVKLPFWTLLFTVAAGGVYCARFGKKTLLNQGISSTLCIVTVYLSTILLCLYMPTLRTKISLPFLAMNDQTAVLQDIFTMEAKSIASSLLQLMILVFLLNTADSLGAGGKSFPTWVATEALAMFFALLFHLLLITGMEAIIPAALNKFAIVPVALIIGFAFAVVCAKFLFAKVFTKENTTYDKMNKFFTSNRMGTLLTTSAMSYLFCGLLSLVLHVRGQHELAFASSNRVGLWIILGMVLLVQFIFEMYYQDRKKA